MVVPVSDDCGIDVAGFAIEHRDRPAVGPAGRKDPLKGSDLSPVRSEHPFVLANCSKVPITLAWSRMIG